MKVVAHGWGRPFLPSSIRTCWPLDGWTTFSSLAPRRCGGFTSGLHFRCQAEGEKKQQENKTGLLRVGLGPDRSLPAHRAALTLEGSPTPTRRDPELLSHGRPPLCGGHSGDMNAPNHMGAIARPGQRVCGTRSVLVSVSYLRRNTLALDVSFRGSSGDCFVELA